MANVSRLTDIWVGICCCHVMPTCVEMTGYIFTSSANTNSNGIGGARIGDLTIGTCSHTGIIVTGSSRNFTNGKGKAHIGSQVTGCNIGTVVTGAPNHNTG